MRIGHRRGEHHGSLKNVSISNLTCEIPFGRPDANYDLRGPDINIIHNPFPSSISGLPDAKIEDVTLRDIYISYPDEVPAAWHTSGAIEASLNSEESTRSFMRSANYLHGDSFYAISMELRLTM